MDAMIRADQFLVKLRCSDCSLVRAVLCILAALYMQAKIWQPLLLPVATANSVGYNLRNAFRLHRPVINKQKHLNEIGESVAD
jgi:hypothetical protein